MPDPVFIAPTEASARWLGRWLFAPNPDPTYFGRKRRARRARGRRIEARQALVFGHWLRVPLDPSRPSLLDLAHKVRVMEDEADSIPTGWLTIEQWAAARRTTERQQGKDATHA